MPALKDKIKHKNRKEPRPKYKICDKADEIALYYGFKPIDTPNIGRISSEFSKILREVETDNETGGYLLDPAICLREKIALLQNLISQKDGISELPAMYYYRGPVRFGGERKKPIAEKHYGLEIMGTGKSVAEATLITASMAILQEEGYENLLVGINSIGDRDSFANFTRELGNYFKKNISSMHSECKQAVRRSIFEALACKHDACAALRENAPKSISFLSEKSRHHFKEILEFLETMEIPYRINSHLLGKKYCSEALFEIHSEKEPVPLALGIRYDGATKRIGFKKEIPSVGVKILFMPKDPKKAKNEKWSSGRKPKFYFIQLGTDAKLQSLRVIELLRHAKIPVCQALSRDKLVSQITTAENMKVPYALIMGQKEALEKSVIVRNMNTRWQDTIKLCDLPAYLANIK